MKHTLIVITLCLWSSIVFADYPPEYFLKINYSTVDNTETKTGIIHNGYIDPDKIKDYLGVPDKLMSFFWSGSKRKVRVWDEILLYKHPDILFDGKASFLGVNKHDIPEKSLKHIKVLHMYAVDYDGALHNGLSKDDILTWSKGNRTLISSPSGDRCHFRIYQHGDNKSGHDLVKRIANMVPKIEYEAIMTGEKSYPEYDNLINELRKHHMVMIEYCG